MTQNDEMEKPFRYEFQKNSREKVVISFSEYKGYKVLDIRVYFLDLADRAAWKRGRKGITISIDHVEELLEGLSKAHAYLKNPQQELNNESSLEEIDEILDDLPGDLPLEEG